MYVGEVRRSERRVRGGALLGGRGRGREGGAGKGESTHRGRSIHSADSSAVSLSLLADYAPNSP